jgi:hypothetical protein
LESLYECPHLLDGDTSGGLGRDDLLFGPEPLGVNLVDPASNELGIVQVLGRRSQPCQPLVAVGELALGGRPRSDRPV